MEGVFGRGLNLKQNKTKQKITFHESTLSAYELVFRLYIVYKYILQ